MGATIRRGARPADNFTIISNALLRDSSISLKARGLAAWLWSHAEDFSLSVERIADQTNTGLAAVRTAIKELEDAGYLTRTRERDARNRTTGMVYTLSEKPEPPSDFPRVENPPVENPPVENRRDYKKTTSKKTNIKKTKEDGAAAGDAAPGLFDAPEAEKPEGLVIPDDRVVTPRDIVALYVDSFRFHHGQVSPLNADIGKVAGAAKRLLADSAVHVHAVEAAAKALGAGSFTDLAGQYRRQLQGRSANQDPRRGVFRAEETNAVPVPEGETPQEANARVQRHMLWLADFNAGRATMADRPTH